MGDKERTNDGFNNDTDMIRGGGNGWPAKFFTRKESGLQNRERPQREQREKDDARVLRGEQSLLWSIAGHLYIIDKPGGDEEKDDSRHQHDEKDKIHDRADQAAQLLALFRLGLLVKCRH